MIYPSNLSKEENGLRLASVAGDLQGKAIEQIRHACKRYRQDGQNRFFPTSGQLLDLMKNPYEDAPGIMRPAYRASDAEHARGAAERAELDEWMRKRVQNTPRA